MSSPIPSPLRTRRSTGLDVPAALFHGSLTSLVSEGPPIIPPRSPNRSPNASYVALPLPLSPPPSPPPAPVTKVTIISIIREEVPIDLDPSTASSRTRQTARRQHVLTRTLGYRDLLRSSSTTTTASHSSSPSAAAAGSDKVKFSQRSSSSTTTTTPTNTSSSSHAASPESLHRASPDSARPGGKTARKTPKRDSVARIAWLWAEGWRARLRGGGDVVERARWEWKLEDEGARYQKEARVTAAHGRRDEGIVNRDCDEVVERRASRKSVRWAKDC